MDEQIRNIVERIEASANYLRDFVGQFWLPIFWVIILGIAYIIGFIVNPLAP